MQVAAAPTIAPALPRSAAEDAALVPRVLGMPAPWFYLGVGALCAPIFVLLPLVQMMGWFLSSLVHEMGHSAVAWSCGMPSMPVIRLDGHAAAVHGEQVTFLLAMIWMALGLAAWQLRDRRLRIATLVVVCLLYPILALTQVRELAHLMGGHVAELAFAVLCFGRALSGGFTSSPVERGLYSTLGWFFVGNNLHLTGGLLLSESVRDWYSQNGSFGLTNDYIRVAEHFFGGSLSFVALIMTVVALCVLPAALFLWKRGLAAARARELR